MFKQYIPAFCKELQSVQMDNFHIENYPKTYLQLLLSQCVYFLHIYAQVLEKAVQYSTKQKEEIVLLDYGAGNGLLGMFARHCGFRKVYSADISKSFVQAAQLLNEQLQNPLTAILTGDWNAVTAFCKINPIPDAVIGTDVIEHIYNVKEFLQNIRILNPQMVTVFTTASVTANPFKSYTIKKLQLQDEYRWSNAEHTDASNPFAGLPFLEVRKRMIQQHVSLSKGQTTLLARATRGMNKEDILKAVTAFTGTGQLPAGNRHPTNTCDPVTGNWTERLLTINEYKTLYKNAGFSLTVYNGFYNEWQAGVKRILLKIINSYTHYTGRAGRWLAAYIVLAGN